MLAMTLPKVVAPPVEDQDNRPGLTKCHLQHARRLVIIATDHSRSSLQKISASASTKVAMLTTSSTLGEKSKLQPRATVSRTTATASQHSRADSTCTPTLRASSRLASSNTMASRLLSSGSDATRHALGITQLTVRTCLNLVLLAPSSS
jgi:hypothetical protein